MTREQKEAKARYIDIVMRETWGNDDGMRKHYEKTLFTAVELSNGYLIPIEKSSIKKSFCFGYSLSRYDSEDYDRANEQDTRKKLNARKIWRIMFLLCARRSIQKALKN